MTELRISVDQGPGLDDRGLNYGDGLFETILVLDGKPCFWDEHWSRLLKGCDRLRIPVPDVNHVSDAVNKALSGRQEAVLKLVLTRGSGGRGYRTPEDQAPWLGISVHDRPIYPASWYVEGIEVHVCKMRLSRNPALAGIKHLNRIEQVLARSEWADEFQEGLMLDLDGRVIEGVMSNLFLLVDNEIITPDLSDCGVAGVIRQKIIDWSHQHDHILRQEESLELEQVRSADAVFVCNSVIGIWPVRKMENVDYQVHHYLLEQLKSEFNPPCG